MCIVTYIPRLFPILLLNGKEIPPKAKRFLKYIPYAALGALIVPGIFNSTGSFYSSLAGTMAALVFAYFKANVILVVLSGIFTSYIIQLLN
jgi:branched-subunit amino acid transport protein